MKNFEFKQVDGAFRWESDFLALEFSSPMIQGFSDFINLTSEKEIMYYYYTVKIFKKTSSWDDDDNEVIEQVLVSERSTHDFPSITQLKWLLEFQLNDNPIKNGQKIEYQNGSVRYSKVMATSGFACDDFYEITKSVSASGEDEKYIVYCGTTFDSQGDLNSTGLRTPYVNRGDLEELLACVTNFIQYSFEVHNKDMQLMANCIEVKNRKIYEYRAVGDTVDKNIIESIYAVGDIVDIHTVVDNQEKEYSSAVITKIEGDEVVLNAEQIIQGSSIAYMSNEPTKEMLTYKELEIANEFIGILSDEERKEFQQESAQHLLKKYRMAIIDRTSMCRDEHAFDDMNYRTGDNVKAVTPIVENVIGIMKEKLAK